MCGDGLARLRCRWLRRLVDVTHLIPHLLIGVEVVADDFETIDPNELMNVIAKTRGIFYLADGRKVVVTSGNAEWIDVDKEPVPPEIVAEIEANHLLVRLDIDRIVDESADE